MVSALVHVSMPHACCVLSLVFLHLGLCVVDLHLGLCVVDLLYKAVSLIEKLGVASLQLVLSVCLSPHLFLQLLWKQTHDW